MKTKELKKLNKAVQVSKMPLKFYKGEHVATLHGPSIVIESVVFSAVEKSKIPMDWHYFGGRAIIYALGDTKKARSALAMSMPGGDISTADL